jgi:hypothetical protein
LGDLHIDNGLQPVGERDEIGSGSAEGLEGAGSALGEVDDVHVILRLTEVCTRRPEVVKN